MYRKGDDRNTRNIKSAKREAANAPQYVWPNRAFVNHYPNSIGTRAQVASGLSLFGGNKIIQRKGGVSQVPIGYNAPTFSVYDDTDYTNTPFGMTALVFGGASFLPAGIGNLVTRSSFIGVSGITFRDAREDNAIHVVNAPAFSPDYWMSI